jgi:glycosyltransferase involved in cell wall biosynthesis
MKILHLAAGNRWTGAAAPAFAEVEALRAEGVDAHYAYVGGYKLQAKLAHFDFAHPIIDKAQNPISFFRTAAAIRHLVDHHGFDLIHAHLTWDHALANFVAREKNVESARTFHARRVLRRDPFTRALLRSSALLCVTNDALREAPAIRDLQPLFTPPPLDLRQFDPDGPDARAQYGIPSAIPLIAVIGKLSKGRGFELAIETFAEIRKRVPDSRFMIIGHGEHRPALEALASSIGVAQHITWAGYHEVDLADHYRAADILLFTAAGSDEGHRAVTEAMACGTVPVSIPLDGIGALIEPELIARDASAAALADVVVRTLDADLMEMRRRVVEQCEKFAYPAAARRLISAYSRIL